VAEQPQLGELDLRFWPTSISCSLIAVLLFGSALPTSAADSENQAEDMAIVGKYMDATQVQLQALRGAEMEVDIDARIPKLKKSATFHALRKITLLGQITYKALGFSGDNTVRKEVITRYLAAEVEGRESGAIAITPENYKFKHRGRWESNGRRVEIFQITPKEKRVGLFKGELWVDMETGMPVRESGEFVKTPSVFLKKIAFVRDYELRDGIAVPKKIESTVDTRIVGRTELEISFSHFAHQAPSEEAPAVDTQDAPVVTPVPSPAEKPQADSPQPVVTQ
jgi:hypothetical protein